LGAATDSAGLVTGLLLSGAAASDCFAPGFSSTAIVFSSTAAGFCSTAFPRCRSINSLHWIGKTISPEAVSPIGMQPPGGTSSFTEGPAGAGLGFTVPVIWARATPLITEKRRANANAPDAEVANLVATKGWIARMGKISLEMLR
jgi:hypothetical protein